MEQGHKSLAVVAAMVHEVATTWWLYGNTDHMLLTQASLYQPPHNEPEHLQFGMSPVACGMSTRYRVWLKQLSSLRERMMREGWHLVAEIVHAEHEVHHFRFVSMDGIVMRWAIHRPQEPTLDQAGMVARGQHITYSLPDDFTEQATLRELVRRLRDLETPTTKTPPRLLTGPVDERDIDL